MKKLYKKLFAFSLVELMISLITISCIAAAFTPVITKKLKKQDVALSNISDISTNCSNREPKVSLNCELCTRQVCIKCGIATCEQGQYLDTNYCGCKDCSSKFSNCESCDNVSCLSCKSGKDGYYLKDGKCEKCTATVGGVYSDGKTCSGSCTTTEGSYCDENGTLRACTYKFSDGCIACTKDACTKCGLYYFLKSGDCARCIPYCYTCSNTSECQVCAQNYLYDSANKTCVLALGDTYIPNCSRFDKGQTISNYFCSSCSKNYIMTNSGRGRNACSTKCSDTIANCISCSSATQCYNCKAGYQLDSSKKCITCNVENCSSCTQGTTDTCEVCNSGYHLSDDNKSCIFNNNKFHCNDANFAQIQINGKKYCVTRRNMGDASIFTIPKSVIVADANEQCYSATQKCCWKGRTAENCDDTDKSYSGCNRTLCNWQAAKTICDSFGYLGKKWRLLSDDEFTQIIKFDTMGKGSNGFLFCDSIKTGLTSWCSGGDSSVFCPGSGSCTPSRNWTANETVPGLYAQARVLNGGGAAGVLGNGDYQYLGHGVRCITEMDD